MKHKRTQLVDLTFGDDLLRHMKGVNVAFGIDLIADIDPICVGDNQKEMVLLRNPQ
jgi:hypothetical protein